MGVRLSSATALALNFMVNFSLTASGSLSKSLRSFDLVNR